MTSNEQIFEAVASIDSSVLVGHTLGELGMVKKVEHTVSGKIKVELLLPVPHPPQALEASLRQALAPFGRGADIDVEVMSE